MRTPVEYARSAHDEHVMVSAQHTPLVILVHGLWMSGFQLSVIKRRLEADGQLRAVAFSYPTLTGSMSDHVASLLAFSRAQHEQTVHFLGHSLGGLVILRALESTDDLPPGRAVLMGTPSQGSVAARGVARRLPFGKAILGATLCEECIEPAEAPRQWRGHRDIGVIAGSSRLGLGRVLAHLEGDHDGTVRVEETRLPGARDHIVIRTSHTGLLLSAEAVRQAAHFLRTGAFDR